MNWERAWMVAAALLVIAAAICLWRNNLSGAFVTGALGACAWFLSYRAQIRSDMVDEDEASDESENSTGTQASSPASTPEACVSSNEVSTGSGSDRVRDNDH